MTTSTTAPRFEADKAAVAAGKSKRQEAMTQRWLNGTHLRDLANGYGLTLDQARFEVAFGLLRCGEVSLMQMQREGYVK